MKKRVKRHAVTQPLDQSYRLIPLTKGQNAIVDVGDFEFVSRWNWYAQKSGRYLSFRAIRMENRKVILMHREIVKCPPEKEVDHKDRNGLNNRRGNLRICTHLENTKNIPKKKNSTKPFKGIARNNIDGTWCARIRHQGRKLYLGTFATPEEAARAYDIAARKYHGEFALINFPITE